MRLYRISILLVFLIFCFSSPSSAAASGRPDSALSRTDELRAYMLGNAALSLAQTTDLSSKNSMSPVKKPAVGILLSAALPGSGEMYAGFWLKGALLMAVEATLWYGYVHYTQRGGDLDAEYRTWGDVHWSEDRWDGSEGSHTLPGTKTQQYYEMIGKYDQFRTGWDDYVEGGDNMTANRRAYLEMRYDSNRQFKRASTCVMLVMGNHLLSMFDTAFTIRRLNREARGQVRMGMIRGGVDYAPSLSLSIRW